MLLMSSLSMCFCGEIRKVQYIFIDKSALTGAMQTLVCVNYEDLDQSAHFTGLWKAIDHYLYTSHL